MQKEEQWLLKEKYRGKATKKFKQDLKRLKKGEPVDYVIGFKEFLGCKIDLSKKPLIPRPETEFWCGQALEALRQAQGKTNKKLFVLDMFSGSGCLGVAVLANVYCATVDFVDKDAKSIAQIKINLKNNFIDAKRFRVIKSDIFKNINKKEKYDFILANPPYIPTKNKSKIQKSVLKYEPKLALFGGKDGMIYINRFLKDAKNRLNAGGKIFMEFDPPQQNQIDKLLKKYKYKQWSFQKDQFAKTRWVAIS